MIETGPLIIRANVEISKLFNIKSNFCKYKFFLSVLVY